MSVTVLGSANVDRVHRVERLPAPGETVIAIDSASNAGGKGNNQAIAASRAGASTRFVVALGRDSGADLIAAELAAASVELVDRRVDAPTGSATVIVDSSAENAIIVHPGANAELVDLTEAELGALTEASIALFQLESPLPTVLAAATFAHDAGVLVTLNAAPWHPLPAGLLEHCDLLVVNELERDALLASGEQIPDGLAVITTLGAAGARIDISGQSRTLPAHMVRAVDSTGAGDTFCGALVAALDGGYHAGDTSDDALPAAPGRLTLSLPILEAAVRFAVAAAALSVQRPGAVPSIPTRAEIDEFTS